MMNKANVPIYTLAAVQGVALFVSIMPDVHVIRDGSESQMAHRVHTDMAVAASLTLGMAVLIGSLTRTTEPVLIAAITAAGTASIYELLLRSTP